MCNTWLSEPAPASELPIRRIGCVEMLPLSLVRKSEGDLSDVLVSIRAYFRMLDIASLSFKKLVNQIVLIAGDSDFVPAAKHARREGIDFVLDPLRHPIRDSLNLHIDGKVTRTGNIGRNQSDKLCVIPPPATGIIINKTTTET